MLDETGWVLHNGVDVWAEQHAYIFSMNVIKPNCTDNKQMNAFFVYFVATRYLELNVTHPMQAAASKNNP